MVIKIDFPNAPFLLFYNSSILLSQKSIIANYFKTRLNKILCAIRTRPFLNEISHTLRTILIKNLKGQEPCPSNPVNEIAQLAHSPRYHTQFTVISVILSKTILT